MEERVSGEREKEKERESEVQSLVLRLRQYQAQAETTSQELVMVQQAIAEHDKAIETIKHLKGLKPGDELIVPIGANSSVYVTLSTTDRIIVRIGGGVSAEKDPDSSIQFLEEKKRELEDSQRQMTALLQKIEQEAQKLQTRLQELVSKTGAPK
ncbi:MAG: prefoldin subunit alpha [Methanophagales archaeon]|nr:prefoldin subunit alpha [Methanophagales archaeon]MCW3140234.1 prefoldin subunit alpha [Methanophagales archaeon]MCW7069679.1 prefoldin subunit alpha [Methanophagales archaeon]MCW7072886.1 prefoldin subunit alpha [Methanophagales archaeon]